MKKTLNISSITNELAGASSYFARAREEKQQENKKTESAAPVVQSQEASIPVPPYGVPRTPVPPRRAIKQRQPFDIFEDQYAELKKIADSERMQGLPGSMSRMVREAIDQYIKQRKR